MVKRVRLPAGAKSWFTGDQLSGWSGAEFGISEYTPMETKEQRKARKRAQRKQQEFIAVSTEIMATAYTPKAVQAGISLL